MSTWQLFSDSSGDGFRWEVVGRILQSDSDTTPTKTLESTVPLPSMADLLLQRWSKLIELEETKPEEIPMFRTGLGKSVALKESSISKAKSILADDKGSYSDLQNSGTTNLQKSEMDAAGSLPMFTTGLGKFVQLKESSIAKALSLLGGNNNMIDSENVLPRESGFGVRDTLFQTASNKKVNVSSGELARAKALLGVEEDDMNGFNNLNQLSSSSSSHQQHEFDATAFQYPSGTGKRTEILNPSVKVPPTKFQTAGGKSLSVSAEEALNCARNLLGDPELGNFFDDNQFVTPQKEDKKLGDIAINSGSSGNTGYIAHEGTPSSNKPTSNSFVSPFLSSSNQFRSVKLEGLASGSNSIKKFDAAVDERDCATHGLPNDKPLASDMAVNNSKENCFVPRAPLVNCSDTAYANNKQDSAQKKRLRKTVSASSGLSAVSSDTQYSKKVLSTRYPEWSPRVYIKDYFGMPPIAEECELVTSTFSSLSDDLVLSILARISRLYYPTLSLVSKKFRSLISSPELYKVRSLLSRTESCLYVWLDLNSSYSWFTLCRRPEKKQKRKKSSENLLVPIPSPKGLWNTMVAVGVVGSNIYSIDPSSTVSVLDCQSHTWHQAPNMQVAMQVPREYAQAHVIDGKIYVIGIRRSKDYRASCNNIQVLDLETQIWNFVSIPILNSEDIYYSAEINGKIFMYVGGDTLGHRGVAYNPRDGTCEPFDSEMLKERFWYRHCVIDKMLFCYNGKEKVFKWFDTKARLWRNLKGLVGITRRIARAPTVRLGNCGGKIAVLWERDSSYGGCQHEVIWCGVIAFERRDGDEIWGTVEWFDIVLRLPKPCHIVHVLATRL